ncbi:MAG: hypothetical protein FWF51_05135 [Chitinivibrionia bacterium]|nr:hypothetical protein [Chitinivibrionia bacterium]
MMRFLILFILILFCISCKTEQFTPEEPAIMRIGSSSLTEKDLINAVGLNATPDQKLNYIREWSDKELTYHAAITSGLDKDDFAKKTIENMKREFLSTRYIQQQMGKIGAIEVSSEEIREEYKNNSQYVRNEPVIRVAKIVIDSQQSGWRARDGLTVENFRERGNLHSSVPIPPLEDIKYAPKKDFSQETWDVIFYLRVGAITLPIKEDGHYAIYLILAKENAGSQAVFEEVTEEIRRSVLNRKQREFVENIYTELRNRDDYYYDSEYMANLEKTAGIPAAQEEKE